MNTSVPIRILLSSLVSGVYISGIHACILYTDSECYVHNSILVLKIYLHTLEVMSYNIIIIQCIMVFSYGHASYHSICFTFTVCTLNASFCLSIDCLSTTNNQLLF